jgi:hypothetical protein
MARNRHGCPRGAALNNGHFHILELPGPDPSWQRQAMISWWDADERFLSVPPLLQRGEGGVRGCYLRILKLAQ